MQTLIWDIAAIAVVIVGAIIGFGICQIASVVMHHKQVKRYYKQKKKQGLVHEEGNNFYKW